MITNKLFNENRRIKMNFIKERKNNGRLNKNMSLLWKNRGSKFRKNFYKTKKLGDRSQR